MNNWLTEPLRKLVEVHYGDSLPDRIRNSTGKVPVYGSNGIVGRHDRAVANAPAIVKGRKGSIGALNYATEPSWPIDTAYFIDDFPEHLSPLWLLLFLSTLPLAHLKQDGPKAGIRREDLYELEIPVPPLAEQRRLVSRIEALTSRLAQARQARQAAFAEADVLSRSAAETAFQALRQKSGVRPIGGVCTTITDGDHNTPRFSESGVSFIFVGNVSSGRLHFENARCVSPDYFKTLKPHRIPQRGDILYSAVGATLGIPAVVNTDEPFCFQRHVAILKPDRSKVNSQFVWHMLRSRTVTKQAWTSITGTAQPTIPLNAIRKLEIPVPSLAEQRQIGARLDALAAKQTELRRLQTETETELAAFTPALLAKAFRGEL